MDLFMQLVNVSNVNSLSFDIWVGISPPTNLLFFKSGITVLTSSTQTGWKENMQTLLKFALIFLMLGWFLYRLMIFSILSELFVSDREWSSHWSKPRFSTMDPKWSLKIFPISLYFRIDSCNQRQRKQLKVDATGRPIYVKRTQTWRLNTHVLVKRDRHNWWKRYFKKSLRSRNEIF